MASDHPHDLIPKLPDLLSIICHQCNTYLPPRPVRREQSPNTLPFTCATCNHVDLEICTDCFRIRYSPRYQCWCCGEPTSPHWERMRRRRIAVLPPNAIARNTRSWMCEHCGYRLDDGSGVPLYQVHELGPSRHWNRERRVRVRWVEMGDMAEEERRMRMESGRMMEECSRVWEESSKAR